MVTMEDVARRAGVTGRTVFNVLHNPKKVSEKTIEKVRKAIKDLNYRENFVARSLVTGRTKTIGFITPDIVSPFFQNMFNDLEDRFIENDYNMIICTCRNKLQMQKYYIEMLLRRGVDGLVLNVSHLNIDYLEEVKSNIPVIVFDAYSRNYPFPNYQSDFAKAISNIVKKLYDQGSRRIVFLDNPVAVDVDDVKLRGIAYCETMKELGLEPEIYEFAGENTSEILDKLTDHIPHAVLSDSDYFIFSLIKRAYEKGIDIKKKCNLVGFDNYILSQIMEFSTVMQDTETMAKAILDDMLAMLSGKEIAPKTKLFDCIFIDRGTNNISFDN